MFHLSFLSASTAFKVFTVQTSQQACSCVSRSIANTSWPCCLSLVTEEVGQSANDVHGYPGGLTRGLAISAFAPLADNRSPGSTVPPSFRWENALCTLSSEMPHRKQFFTSSPICKHVLIKVRHRSKMYYTARCEILFYSIKKKQVNISSLWLCIL